jgi:hypothetical protein
MQIVLALVVAAVIFAVIWSAVWVLSGYQTTNLPFKPQMWRRRRRAEVLADIVAQVRAGKMSSTEGWRAYERAVGMDYLCFAFGPHEPDNYIRQIGDASLARMDEERRRAWSTY